MPEDWDFNHASVERGGIRPLLVGKGDPIIVPHRCNGSNPGMKIDGPT